MLRIGKRTFFTNVFFNIDFPLIMELTGMNTAMHVAETHWEGRVSLKLSTLMYQQEFIPQHHSLIDDIRLCSHWITTIK